MIESIYSLIRPTPNYYPYFYTEVHGITYYDTINTADFPVVWLEIALKIAELPLFAHYSSFDESCLRFDATNYDKYCLQSCVSTETRNGFVSYLSAEYLQVTVNRVCVRLSDCASLFGKVSSFVSIFVGKVLFPFLSIKQNCIPFYRLFCKEKKYSCGLFKRIFPPSTVYI